ncbi:MAG: NUDIX hydrolase [Chloroflexota bacterium]|nr:NUDIX hydrolase [Chloroflexota bacterium]
MQPEEQIASREIYDGKIIKVRVDDILMRNGNQSVREVVDHANAVVIVPIDDDGNVHLVRQYRYAAQQNLLEAPAGLVETGEDPDDCAQREMAEEIGYASRNLRILGGFWSSPGFCTEFMYAYLAKDLVPRSLQADDDEDIQVEKVPLSRIPQLIRLGEIQDAKTIAALLMATCIFNA